ncbi:hypothetical protein R1flu_022133 [Riccia fluitans]|uniref:Uncharacterized protein n=1 Tax=Riccia fluitans TaxID=41844 RepID=A0ABD1ZSL0_9MARC
MIHYAEVVNAEQPSPEGASLDLQLMIRRPLAGSAELSGDRLSYYSVGGKQPLHSSSSMSFGYTPVGETVTECTRSLRGTRDFAKCYGKNSRFPSEEKASPTPGDWVQRGNLQAETAWTSEVLLEGSLRVHPPVGSGRDAGRTANSKGQLKYFVGLPCTFPPRNTSLDSAKLKCSATFATPVFDEGSAPSVSGLDVPRANGARSLIFTLDRCDGSAAHVVSSVYSLAWTLPRVPCHASTLMSFPLSVTVGYSKGNGEPK